MKGLLLSKILVEESRVNIIIRIIKEIKLSDLKMLPKNEAGAPLTKPCSFIKAIIDPVTQLPLFDPYRHFYQTRC